MKNYEKYAEEINGIEDSRRICETFIKPVMLEREDCIEMSCEHCRLLQQLWMLEEYEEPETDWSKVAVDTPILVKRENDEKWYRRHFAKYEDGEVYTWGYGRTSWTGRTMDFWKYAKLAEVEDGTD